jgi:hypothetical protein
MRAFIVATSCFLTAAPLVAQQGRFVGIVTRDSGGTGIPTVEVSLPDLKRGARTNYKGEFRMDEIPLGKHEVVIRHPGFEPLVDTVELAGTAITAREFVLRPLTHTLDTVAVVKEATRYHSARLIGFEQRRKEGFGHFLDETELRKHDVSNVNTVLARMPGIRLIPYMSAVYATSARTAFGMGRAHADPLDSKSPSDCWLTVYLDGVRIYNIGMKTQAPDFAKWNVSDFAGIELYLGGSTIPPQFNSSDNGCGLLLLWTRER